MISLSLRLTPKPGHEAALESAIDIWMGAMTQQDGFINAVMLKPYKGEDASTLGLPEQTFEWDVISFWESEEHRYAWSISNIHAEVIAFVNDAILAEGGKQAVISNVERDWNFL